MPYPNPDGRWYTGERRNAAWSLLSNAANNNVSQLVWDVAALPSERTQYATTPTPTTTSFFGSTTPSILSGTSPWRMHPPCGKHCDRNYYDCSESSRVLKQWEKNNTRCPCSIPWPCNGPHFVHPRTEILLRRNACLTVYWRGAFPSYGRPTLYGPLPPTYTQSLTWILKILRSD